MHFTKSSYQKIKKKYLKFIKSQEVLSEPFRDKIGQLDNFFLPISKKIFKKYLDQRKTKVIGLTGGQESGKSTISNIFKIIFKEGFDLKTVIFSIDDFYKTLNERKKMSNKVSKLFLTRGVPGTHDTRLLFECLKNLKKKKIKNLLIPKFDKSVDDATSESSVSTKPLSVRVSFDLTDSTVELVSPPVGFNPSSLTPSSTCIFLFTTV